MPRPKRSHSQASHLQRQIVENSLILKSQSPSPSLKSVKLEPGTGPSTNKFGSPRNMDEYASHNDAHNAGRYESPDGQLFACPYSKYDPSRYSHINTREPDYRNCSTGFYSSIARLKQHLYRVHDRSQKCCQLCWNTFPDDDKLAKHIAAQNCKARPCPEEKMDSHQRHAVQEREQGRPIQSWYKIYEALFPDDEDSPASPFAEWVVGEDLRDVFDLMQSRLPQLLFQIAAQRQPALRGTRPTKDTTFPTTAGLIMRAIEQCKKEFTATEDRLRPVFASEPPADPQRPGVIRHDSSQSTATLSRHMQTTELSDTSSDDGRPSRYSSGSNSSHGPTQQIMAAQAQARRIVPSNLPMHSTPFTTSNSSSIMAPMMDEEAMLRIVNSDEPYGSGMQWRQ